jgi:hypothetical protein
MLTGPHVALLCLTHVLTFLLRDAFLCPSHRGSYHKRHSCHRKEEQRQAQVGSWRQEEADTSEKEEGST